MSKFDYEIFYGGYDILAVSKEKYTKEQAIEIAKVELENTKKPYYIAIGNGFVRHRAGIDEDNNPRVCWWLEYTVDKNESFAKYYEHLEVENNE